MKKICCNCAHCIRENYKGHIVCVCEIYDRYLHYGSVVAGWCKNWEEDEEEEEDGTRQEMPV